MMEEEEEQEEEEAEGEGARGGASKGQGASGTMGTDAAASPAPAGIPRLPRDSRGLRVCAVKALPRGGVLVAARGSVVGFEGDAIVNAANEGCQGGGGVDGAITTAGGPEMAAARAALPVIKSRMHGARCRTGSAVVTTGGRLNATHCIHAVGPNYNM